MPVNHLPFCALGTTSRLHWQQAPFMSGYTLEGVIQRPAGWSFVWVLRSWRLLYTLMVDSVWSHLIPSAEEKGTLRLGTVSAIILWCPTCRGLIERANSKHQLLNVGTQGKRDPSLHFVLDVVCVKTKSFTLPHLNTRICSNELVSIAWKFACDTRGRGQSHSYEIWADTKYIVKQDPRTLKSTLISMAAATYVHWNDFSLQEKLLTKSNYQMQASFQSLLGFRPSRTLWTAALLVVCAAQEVTAHSSSRHLSPPWCLRLSAQIWKNLPYGSSNPKFN